MSRPVHIVDMIGGSNHSQPDRLRVGVISGIANGAGGGAGAAVTVAVAFTTKASLPANYAVFVSPNQDATWYVSAKTAVGFNVTLTPRLAASTLASGTFDVLVTA